VRAREIIVGDVLLGGQAIGQDVSVAQHQNPLSFPLMHRSIPGRVPRLVLLRAGRNPHVALLADVLVGDPALLVELMEEGVEVLFVPLGDGLKHLFELGILALLGVGPELPDLQFLLVEQIFQEEELPLGKGHDRHHLRQTLAGCHPPVCPQAGTDYTACASLGKRGTPGDPHPGAVTGRALTGSYRDRARYGPTARARYASCSRARRPITGRTVSQTGLGGSGHGVAHRRHMVSRSSFSTSSAPNRSPITCRTGQSRACMASCLPRSRAIRARDGP